MRRRHKAPTTNRQGHQPLVAVAAIDRSLVFTWLCVLAFGLVMVASASLAMGGSYFVRHGVYLGIALFGFLAVVSVPLAFWQRLRNVAGLAAVAFCAVVLVPGIGQSVNGATRWIDLGFITLQPSEFARLFLLIYLAGFLAHNDDVLKQRGNVLLAPLLLLGAMVALLVAEPDLGSVVVLGCAVGGLVFLAGVPLRYFLPLAVAGAGLFAYLALAQPYRLERLASFTDPWATANTSGYQLVQALIAFGRGELFGLGLGGGIQKLFYLPEAHNDFIFAVVGEELGLAGALLLLLLLALLVYRILAIGYGMLAHDEKFGGYLCYGVGIVLGIQSLINLGVASGLLPTKGITLPFVSYGGNSLIVCCALVGLVVRAQWEWAKKQRVKR